MERIFVLGIFFFRLFFFFFSFFCCFGLHKNAAASFGALTRQGFKKVTHNNKMNTSSVPSRGLNFLHWFLRKPVCACLCKPLALHPLQGDERNKNTAILQS